VSLFNRSWTDQKMQSAPTEPTRRDALATLRIDRSQKTVQKSSGGFFKWFGIFVSFVLLLISGYFAAVRMGWVNAETTTAGGWLEVPDIIKNRPEVRIVRTTIEKGRSADATVVATGYLESRRQAKIGARAPGRIQSVSVEEGSRVKKDEVLAVLEHADLDASLAATKATLARSLAAIEEQTVVIEQNKREYSRAKSLLASRSISDTEHDKAKFDYDSSVARLKSMKTDVQLAEARLREAEQLKENMFIRAPFDGTVISKDAEVGESILPGGMGDASGRGSAVTIADLDNLEVDCDVKEDYISRVRSGQQAEVSVDAVPGRRYHATVRKVIPMGDRARATIKVKVTITDADDRLFPDMSSTVYFLPEPEANETQSEEPRMFCPEECVRTDEQGEFIWIIDAKAHAQQARVTTGKRKDNRVEILSGLKGDEKLIADPPKLNVGQPVKVSE
jgi:RND family efflux transporter MFP subunit